MEGLHMDLKAMEMLFEIKQEDDDFDGIDKTALVKLDHSYSYPIYGDYCDRIKYEEVELNDVNMFDSTLNMEVCMNTEDELMIEKTEPKIDTIQHTEYGSDTMANSDIVLKGIRDESEYGKSMEMNEIKVEHDDEVKVKIEIAETDIHMSSGESEENVIQRLNEELEIKDEDDEDSESALNEKLWQIKHLSSDLCLNKFEELKTSSGYGVESRSENRHISDHNYCKHSAYSECMSPSCKQVDGKKETEHFCSNSDLETCLKNANITPICSSPSNLHVCTGCHISHNTREMLDEHIIQNHPDLIPLITCKVYYECQNCTYKTSFSTRLIKHLLQKCKVPSKYNFIRCMHCSAVFKSKPMLNDHINKVHSDSIATVSSINKRRECTRSSYKTVLEGELDQHMSKNHPGTSCKIHECTKCTYKTTFKMNFDNHILRKHPDLSATVSSKIYKCPNCTYKTTLKARLDDHILRRKHSHLNAAHMLKRSRTDRSFKCLYCNASFKRKIPLEDHILKTHPKFISSVCSRIHECTKCAYKTTVKVSFDNHILRKHPNLSATVSSKIYECPNCTYKTTLKARLDDHILRRKHSNFNAAHMLKSSKTDRSFKCLHCSASFKRKIPLEDHILKTHPKFISSVCSRIHECTKCTYKTTVKVIFDNHILRKHPNLNATVSSKIYECPNCTYKTTLKARLDYHILRRKHSDSNAAHMLKSSKTDRSFKCLHCSASFKRKIPLEDHILKTHPKFISSVCSRIHECTKCTYKTTVKVIFDNHILRKHPDLSATVSSKIHECPNCTYKTTLKARLDDHILRREHSDLNAALMLKCSRTDKSYECLYCSAAFKRKIPLEDHILKIHPKLISSVRSRIHECTKCTYKTTVKVSFDNHILRKHPDLSATVSSKIHECPNCTYKTTLKARLDDHILRRKHSDLNAAHMLKCSRTDRSYKCLHCNASFKRKLQLQDHILKIHPKFISSVCSRIYECTQCTYKTTLKVCFDNHILRKHPDLSATVSSKIHECPNCTYRTTLKARLDDHTLRRKHLDLNAAHILKRFRTEL